LLLRVECPVDLGGLRIIDHHHGPDAPDAISGPGAVLSHFQPVECVDRVAPVAMTQSLSTIASGVPA